MIGQLLDRRYRIIKVLGSSAFGQTYLAADTHRPGYPECVAKQLRPPSNTPHTYQIIQLLFKKKAETLEKLGRHDRIPQLLAFFEENREFYLVEEFINGQPLSSELEAGVPLTEEKVVGVVREVLEIIDFVHSSGTIHGNIQPDNIIRRASDKKLVLINFGSIKEITSQLPSSKQKRISSSDLISGPYKPLEQLENNLLFNSDIYALGMIAVQGLTGLSTEDLAKLQESANNGGEFLWRHRAQVSQELADIVDKMIFSDCQERYQTAAEVLADLNVIDNQSYTNSQFNYGSSTQFPYSGFGGEQTSLKSSEKVKKPFPKMPVIFGLAALLVGAAIWALLSGDAQKATVLKTQGSEKQIRGDQQGAVEDLSRALQLNPNDAEAYYKRGNVNYDQGNFEAAIEDYTNAIRLDKNLNDVYYNRGLAYFELKDYPAAIEDYNQIIRLNSNDAEAYYKRGRAYFEIKDYGKAIEDYTEAIRRNSNNEISYINRGLAYSAAGDKQAAIADYTQAIRLNPQSADAYYSRGRARFFLADYQGAMSDYSEAIKIKPDYGEAYSNRCGAYLNLSEYQKATEDCTKALELNRKDMVAYENRCIAYYNLEQYKKAIEDCTQSISLNPNNSKVYSNRGLAKAAEGNKAGAIDDFSQAIRVNPGDAIAYSNRAGVYAGLENFSSAIEDYTQAIRLKPDYNTAYYARGLLRAGMGDKQGAKEDFQKASKLCLDQGNTGCYNDAQYQIKTLP